MNVYFMNSEPLSIYSTSGCVHWHPQPRQNSTHIFVQNSVWQVTQTFVAVILSYKHITCKLRKHNFVLIHCVWCCWICASRGIHPLTVLFCPISPPRN